MHKHFPTSHARVVAQKGRLGFRKVEEFHIQVDAQQLGNLIATGEYGRGVKITVAHYVHNDRPNSGTRRDIDSW